VSWLVCSVWDYHLRFRLTFWPLTIVLTDKGAKRRSEPLPGGLWSATDQTEAINDRDNPGANMTPKETSAA